MIILTSHPKLFLVLIIVGALLFGVFVLHKKITGKPPAKTEPKTITTPRATLFSMEAELVPCNLCFYLFAGRDDVYMSMIPKDYPIYAWYANDRFYIVIDDNRHVIDIPRHKVTIVPTFKEGAPFYTRSYREGQSSMEGDDYVLHVPGVAYASRIDHDYVLCRVICSGQYGHAHHRSFPEASESEVYPFLVVGYGDQPVVYVKPFDEELCDRLLFNDEVGMFIYSEGLYCTTKLGGVITLDDRSLHY